MSLIQLVIWCHSGSTKAWGEMIQTHSMCDILWLSGLKLILSSFLKIVPSTTKSVASGLTSHFTLTNMKGTFSAKVSDAVQLMRPIPITSYFVDDNLLDPTEATPSLNASQSALQFPVPTPVPSASHELDHHELRKRLALDPHTIPYGEQTGRTKYAPMPKRAGTTIADKPATPQYPPFPFSIATTYLPAPTVDYTDTAYATWTAHSIENTVRL
jgi:hypothetical protein